MKVAVVTGITGQDGSYLAESLLKDNYKVIGLIRRSSTNNLYRIKHILDNFNLSLEEFDITDGSSCSSIIDKYQPDELYNLAAMSHVGTSFSQPLTTFDINTIGVTNLLEAIRQRSPKTKFYQASTSEIFGKNYTVNGDLKYQDEDTAFMPQSPYAVSKLASHHMVRIYRESYGLYCCSGILFNHESPRRGENFVTRKITKYISQLINHKIPHNEKLKLGNIESYRDWGHAADYVEAMRLMLQLNNPQDFVIGTGESHTVKEFLQSAFGMVNLKYECYVEIDPSLYRPNEVSYLKCNNTKAKEVLNWRPNISFYNLVYDMIMSDIELFK